MNSILSALRPLISPLTRPVMRRLNLELRSYPQNRHCTRSTYQPYNMKQRFLELQNLGFNPKYFLDAGANRGGISGLAKEVFPEIKCYLIEPMEELADGLREFVRLYPDCKFLPGALSHKTGTTTLHIDLSGDADMVAQSLTSKASATTVARTVNTYAVDDLISSQEINIPDLIKLDVEGYELEVLRGATKTFGHTEVYVLEANFWKLDNRPDFLEVINFMAEREYVVYDFAGLLRRPSDNAPGLIDIVFVKRDGLFRSATW